MFNFGQNNYDSPLVHEELATSQFPLSNFQNNLVMFPFTFDSSNSNIMADTNFSTPNPLVVSHLQALNSDGKSSYSIQEVQTSIDMAEMPEVPEVQDLEDEEIVASEESVSEFAGGAAILGGIGAAVASHVASNTSAQDVNSDLSGHGLGGSDFGAAFQAREDSQHDSTVGIENMSLIGISSLAGPEGLAAGLITAGLNSAFNQADVATVQSNLGTQVPVNNI